MTLKLIHLSDLHFHAYPEELKLWCSKRSLGVANLFFRRAKEFPLERAQKLVETVQGMEWDHLIISGDLTTTALASEFRQAREVLNPLLKDPAKVTVVPGNHDRYVVDALQPDLFLEYFGEFFGLGPIRTKQISAKWHVIGWDSTHPNDWLTAAGTVTRETILASEAYLQNCSKDAKFILVNHYPLWIPERYPFKVRHELYNFSTIQAWLITQAQIRLYLHGHVHHNWHHWFPREFTPLLMVNSASSTQIPEEDEPSSFHQIIIDEDQIHVHPIAY